MNPSHKRALWSIIIVCLLAVGIFFAFPYGRNKVKDYIKNNKEGLAAKSLNIISKTYNLLPVEDDKKKELAVLDQMVQALTEKNGKTWTFMILLQNNMELRPGGGFLGQYAIVKIKDGQVVSTLVEDANLLDQRITAKVAPPYPFFRMMQLKTWKFRDSNFSPDFPTNVSKAKYFYRLSGRSEDFDGVIAVNADVFNDVLKITGPIEVPGYSATFDSSNATLKLEEIVEKAYIMNPELDTQNRKAIMKKMAPIIMDKLFTAGNISQIASFVHEETQKKNIMFNFKDPQLQSAVESVFWDGKVATNWGSDYLMVVDANMGALKTDYYMRREMSYELDLTQPKPTATLYLKYKNTAPYGDWRTSDYHEYMRVYVPKGSVLLEREMVGSPLTNAEFEKTYFGFVMHVVMGHEVNARIKYELPENFDRENYKLLVQKQSGSGAVPFKVHVKTSKGELNQEVVLTKDMKFEVK